MMIARSTIDGAGSAANVARRHLHRGQLRIPEPMRLEMQSWSRVVHKASSKQFPLDAVTWKYLFGRCGTKAAIRHITHKLKYVPFLQRVALSNYRGGERCF